MALTETLEQLKKARCDRGVLTIYLNTMRTRNSEWKLRLKNGLKKLKEYIEVRGNEAELKDYLMLKNKITKEMKEQQLNLQKSIVIFASVNQNIWEIHHLQVEVENEFYWEKYPVIEQLETIHKRYPITGIAVIQPKEMLAIEVKVGEISDEMYFSLDEEKGIWNNVYDISLSGRKSIELESKSRNGSEVRWIRSLKGIARKIDQLAQEKKWKEIYLVGHLELVEDVKKYLRASSIKIVPKNLYNKSSRQIVVEVLRNRSTDQVSGLLQEK